MELKDFQQRVLDTLDAYLDELVLQRAKAEKVKQANARETDPDLVRPVPDFPRRAWEALKAAGRLPPVRRGYDYSPRADGAGEPVPNVCLKIPTGGGKTLLAAASVSRVLGRYLSGNTGFVLWVVPNEAIYTQTRRQLTDREHPYRQMLDRAAAGRVKVLEKNDRLDRRDVETHLCVMLLMLQSANRETKEMLRVFRDRGNVHGFFPPADDFHAHHDLLQRIPNLTAYADGHRDQLGSVVQDSLGNVLRLVRPVVVMDEGHRAYTARALDTLYGLNPCFLLELSATPKDRPADRPPRFANWLVDVRGKELADEEMIKLPINVKVKSGDDWRDCLRESLELTNRLQAAADVLGANTARYVRPILLVQVERTGREQREAGLIHAEDAREFLLGAGLAEREIAVKTSEVNDLRDPENQDLLSPTNCVRAIITKQALQEGWDCPFAYVLCALGASRNLSAMTQLVGRILRQPDALKTGEPQLDECYVLCHHAHTREVVAAIKRGLEEDGMADLAQSVKEAAGGDGGAPRKRRLARRPALARAEILLPVVCWAEGEGARPLDYEQDVLSRLDWSQVRLDELARRIPDDGSHLAVSQTTRISVAEGGRGESFTATTARAVEEAAAFDPVYATRVLTDIVPNPWVAREVVGGLLRLLRGRGFDDARLGAMSGFVLEELRRFLAAERDRLAEGGFAADLKAGRIQFRLRAGGHDWRMPQTVETELPEGSPQLIRESGTATEKSVFAPVYQSDFNKDEAEFACYLDGRPALLWWHRNAAKAGHYHLQGWRKHKVYPDFIFAVTEGDGRERVVVLETKGDQLEGNLDTEYKRKLLSLLSESYQFERVAKAGELGLDADGVTEVSCDLVPVSEWKTHVPNKFFSG